jgi:hypothetical protein
VFGIVEGVLVLVLTGGVAPYVIGMEFLFLFLFMLVGSRPTRLVSYGMSSMYYIPGQFAICLSESFFSTIWGVLPIPFCLVKAGC